MQNRKRYPNISTVILGIAVLLLGIESLYTNTDGFSLFMGLPFLLKIIPVVTAPVAMCLWFFVKLPDKIKSLLKIILWILFSFYVIENIVVPIINSYIDVKDLVKIPTRSKFLDSIVYIVIRYWPDFLRGLGITLQISLIGTVIGLVLALILVVFRTMPINNRNREALSFFKQTGIVLTKSYVNIFRGTPMMVQAVIIYYLMPVVLASILKMPQAEIDKIFTLTVAALVVVSLNTAAYLTEVFRGGIEAVDKGQLEAARSLGMSYRRSMLHIVLPQGIKNALPAICNEFIINIKDTSVLNVIGVAELFFVAQDAKYRYFRTYEPFLIAAFIYLVVTLSASKIILKIERKMNLTEKELTSSN